MRKRPGEGGVRVRGGGGQVEEILPVKPYALQETQLTLEKKWKSGSFKNKKSLFPCYLGGGKKCRGGNAPGAGSERRRGGN